MNALGIVYSAGYLALYGKNEVVWVPAQCGPFEA
jgi:hypothetical protein